MGTLQDLPGELNLTLFVARAVTITLNFPAALTGRTFTCSFDATGTPVALTVTVLASAMSFPITAAQLPGEYTGSYTITETTGGGAVPYIVGVVKVTRNVGAQTTSATVTVNTTTATVTVGTWPTMPTYADSTARDAAITTPAAGMQVYLTTPHIFTWYDTEWRGEWVTSFVPTVAQGVTTNIAKTTTKSQWRYDGPMVEWEFVLNITAAGTAASVVTLTLPVTALSSTNASAGSAMIIRSGPLRYHCILESTSTTTIAFGSDSAGTAQWGSSPSIALANGDSLRGTARYRWI
jgi:hypothetical protein